MKILMIAYLARSNRQDRHLEIHMSSLIKLLILILLLKFTQVFENTLRLQLQKKVESHNHSMLKCKQEWNRRIAISVSMLTDLVKILSEGRKPPYFLGGLARSLISMTMITIMKHSNMKAIKVSTSGIREEQYQEHLRKRKRSK